MNESPHSDASPDRFDHGRVRFACRVRPGVALLFLIVGATFLAITTDALFLHWLLPPKRGIVFYVLFGGIGLISLAAVLLAVYMLLNPGILFAVTDRGIVLYDQGRPAGFVPWSNVDSLEFVRRPVRVSNEPGLWFFIAVHVRTSDEWSPDTLPGYIADEGIVLLDAGAGTPSGRRLLEMLEDARRDHKLRGD
ncbi:MAG: hypothetical protein D6725_14050 [Planctomycetota bacterium]|nr:MAG: hypothetical protein D6725_14050 [Planctomycetota bacterium]